MRSNVLLSIRLVLGTALAASTFAATTSSAPDAPPTYAEHQDLSYLLDDAGAKRPIKTVADWNARRAHIAAGIETVMGPLPKPEKPVPLGLQVVEAERMRS